VYLCSFQRPQSILVGIAISCFVGRGEKSWYASIACILLARAKESKRTLGFSRTSTPVIIRNFWASVMVKVIYMTSTSLRIDWLSVTSRSWGATPHNDLDNAVSQESKGAMGYTKAVKYVVSGVLVMHNPDNAKMGKHIVYSGNALSILENLGTQAIEILKYHLDQGHMIARIDIAIDVYDSELSIEALATMAKEGKHSTNSKTYLHINGSAGETLYIGSLKNRKKLLRIYDKGAESETSENWKRVELEAHGKSATMIGKELIMGGLAVVPSIIKGFCDFPENPEWVSVTGNEFLAVRVKDEKTNDTVKWLMEVVAPAFARQALADETLIKRWTVEVLTLMDSPDKLGIKK